MKQLLFVSALLFSSINSLEASDPNSPSSPSRKERKRLEAQRKLQQDLQQDPFITEVQTMALSELLLLQKDLHEKSKKHTAEKLIMINQELVKRKTLQK